jgi:HEAT repeat protein
MKHAKSKLCATLAVGVPSFLWLIPSIDNNCVQQSTQTQVDVCIDKFENHNQQYFNLEHPEYYTKSPPALPAALKDDETEVDDTTHALETTSPASTQAVMTFIAVFNNQNWNILNWFALVLGSIPSEPEDIVLALIEALKDEESEIRTRATYVLGSMNMNGKAKEFAIPALIETLTDEKSQVRIGAIYALGSIGSEAKVAIPAIVLALTTVLKDREESVRSHAASALEGIGIKAKQAVPILIETLNDRVEIVRTSAALALGSIGAEAQEAIPALIDTLKDQQWYVRSFTAEALVQITEALGDRHNVSSIPQLHAILAALEENQAEFPDQIKTVRSCLETLSSLS